MTRKTVPAFRDAPMCIYVRRVEPRRHLGVALPEKLRRFDHVHDLEDLASDVAGENGGGRYKGRVYDQMNKKTFLGVYDFTIGGDPLIAGLPIEPAPRKPGKTVTAKSPEPRAVKTRPAEPSPGALRRERKRAQVFRELRAKVAALVRASDRARSTVPERKQPRPHPQKNEKPTVPVPATPAPPPAAQGDLDATTKQPEAFQAEFAKALVSARQREAETETELAASMTKSFDMLATALRENQEAVARAVASRDVTTPFAAVSSLDQEAKVMEAVSAVHRRKMEARDAVTLAEIRKQGSATKVIGDLFLQTVVATHRRSRARRRRTDPKLMRAVDRGFDTLETLLFGRPLRDKGR